MTEDTSLFLIGSVPRYIHVFSILISSINIAKDTKRADDLNHSSLILNGPYETRTRDLIRDRDAS